MAITANMGNVKLNYSSTSSSGNVNKINDNSEAFEQVSSKTNEMNVEEYDVVKDKKLELLETYHISSDDVENIEYNNGYQVTLKNGIEYIFDENNNVTEIFNSSGASIKNTDGQLDEILKFNSNIVYFEGSSDGGYYIQFANTLKLKYYVTDNELTITEVYDVGYTNLLDYFSVKDLQKIGKIPYDADTHLLTLDFGNGVEYTYSSGSIGGMFKYDGKLMLVNELVYNISDISNITTENSKTIIEYNNGLKVTYNFTGSIEEVIYKGCDITDIRHILKNADFTIKEEGNIKYFSSGNKSFQYVDNKLSIATIGNNTFYYDEKGNIYKHEGDDLSIFDANNIEIGQFGGNQHSFTDNAKELLQDPSIKKILKEHFPNATEEDYVLLFKKITNTGCGYIAMTNTIFKEYEGKEQQFLDKFGYSMYKVDSDGNIDYNYEALALDYYLSYWHTNKKMDIDDIYGNIEKVEAGDESMSNVKSTGATGTDDECYYAFSTYMKVKYGLNYNFEHTVNKDVDGTDVEEFDIEQIKKALNDGKQVVYSSSGYDLYKETTNSSASFNMADGSVEYDSSTSLELYNEDGGGHAMVVTRITDDDQMVVSSWGKEYVLDISDQRWGDFWIVDFNAP